MHRMLGPVPALALLAASCGGEVTGSGADGGGADAGGADAGDCRDASAPVDASTDGSADADAPDAALGTTWYVSSTGDDGNEGTTPESAWRTVARVNDQDLEPGERVLFEGGQSFDGTLRLDAEDRGTPAAPVEVSAFGEGRATLSAGEGAGVVAHNTAGLSLSRLNVVGSGRESNGEDGILFFVDLPGDVKLEHVSIDQVDVSGFGKSGLVIGADNGNSGFRHVWITRVRAHDNALGGIQVYGAWSETPTGYAMEDVYIGHCFAHDNSGVAGLSHHSGSGIVIGGVDGGVIERSVAYNNGSLNTAVGGPVGIWAWDSNDVTIEHNEAYGNRTDSSADGGGFDLDGGTTNSVMQYNYSHDNDGPGFLLAQYSGAPRPFANNVVRYNISQNDARSGRHGAIHFWSASAETHPIRDIAVYDNTVFLSPSGAGGSPLGLYFHGSSTRTRDVRIHNNVFVTTGDVPLVHIDSEQVGLLIHHNAYWPSGDAFRIVQAGTTHGSLGAWRAATGHEEVGGAATGIETDPLLSDPGGGPTLGDADLLDTVTAYRLEAGSPLIDAGFDLGDLGTLGPGSGATDYYGTAVPQGGAHDIGAHERDPAAPRAGSLATPLGRLRSADDAQPTWAQPTWASSCTPLWSSVTMLRRRSMARTSS